VIPGLSAVVVATITSSIRDTDSEVFLDENDGMKHPCAVNLHNLSTVRKERLRRRVAILSKAKMDQICAALAFASGCDS